MVLNVAVQMDPIERINIRGDSTFALLLEAQARGHKLSYYTPDKLALLNNGVFATVQPLSVRDKAGDHFTLGEPKRVMLSRLRRRAAAPGSAVRSCLHHDDASPGKNPSGHAGGERPGAGAQRAGKDVRQHVRRPDAADADHARSRRDQGVPRRAQRHRDEAAIRPRRRRGVPDRQGRSQFRLAVRHVLCDVPRAVGDPEIPPGSEGRRQAHHPGRRRVRRRGEPRAGCRTTCAPTWCAAARRRTPNCRRGSRRFAGGCARRFASAACCSSAST